LTVIQKARQRLQELETTAQRHAEQQQSQLPLFDLTVETQTPTPKPSAVEALLEQLNPDELTPRQALEQLYQLKTKLDSAKN
jgi:DNA mismatch repair protein MutS